MQSKKRCVFKNQSIQKKKRDLKKEETIINKVKEQPVIDKSPTAVIKKLSKKYRIVGVWRNDFIGLYYAIIKRDGAYYCDLVNIEDEKIIKLHNRLKRVSSTQYQYSEADDMPGLMTINGDGDMETYVYNPDVDEWVYMGSKERVW